MNHDSDVDIKQYISSKTLKSMLDVSYKTLDRWAKTDKVRFIKKYINLYRTFYFSYNKHYNYYN